MLSVSKMRGCFAAAGIPALFLVAIALVVGLLQVGRCDNSAGPGGEQGPYVLGEVMFSVNDAPAYEGELRFLRAEGAKNASPSSDPMTELNRYVEPITICVERATILAMAKWQNVKAEESEVFDYYTKLGNENLEQSLKQAQDMHQLMVTSADAAHATAKKSKGADSKEAKEAQENLDKLKAMNDDQIFSQTNGVDLTSARAQIAQSLDLIKSEPMRQHLLLANIYQTRLVEKYKSEVDVTSDMVKESYDRVTYKEIVLLKLANPNWERDAKEALQQVQKGMDFDQAILKYSSRKPTDPTKKEQFSTTKERLELWQSPDVRPISEIKMGKISGLIPTEVGISIAQVTKVETATPPNVESVKAARIDQIKQVIGGSTFESEKRKFSAKAKFEWKSEEAKTLYDYSQMTAGDRLRKLDGEANRQKRIDAWKEIYDRVRQSDSLDSTLSALLQYSAFEHMSLEVLPGPEKEKLIAERAELYRAIEAEIPYPMFRMKYVQSLLDVKDGEGALKELVAIAEGLYEATDIERQRVKEIEAHLPQAANYAPKDSPLIGNVQAELQRWHKEDDEAKRIAEEQKKQDAKAQADLKKQAESKAPVPPESKAKGG